MHIEFLESICLQNARPIRKPHSLDLEEILGVLCCATKEAHSTLAQEDRPAATYVIGPCRWSSTPRTSFYFSFLTFHVRLTTSQAGRRMDGKLLLGTIPQGKAKSLSARFNDYTAPCPPRAARPPILDEPGRDPGKRTSPAFSTTRPPS